MKSNDALDLVIIGGGPAGLAAGLYASRARLNTILVEKTGFGGQLLKYEKVDNYPGFPDGITAFDLSDLFSRHAKKFGLETRSLEVQSIEVDGGEKTVRCDGADLKTRAIILATGASPMQLRIPGETELTGRGVSYCAVCDGPFFREEVVAVVGGGDTAVEEAIYLTKFAKKVYLIHRRDSLRAMKILQEEAFANEKIEVVWNSVATSIEGGDRGVERMALKNVKTGEASSLELTGVFVFVGLHPATVFLPPSVNLDEHGFVITNEHMETSVPGIYAAGDCRSKDLRQIVTAVGDGAAAAYQAGRYIEKLHMGIL